MHRDGGMYSKVEQAVMVPMRPIITRDMLRYSHTTGDLI